MELCEAISFRHGTMDPGPGTHLQQVREAVHPSKFHGTLGLRAEFNTAAPLLEPQLGA